MPVQIPIPIVNRDDLFAKRSANSNLMQSPDFLPSQAGAHTAHTAHANSQSQILKAPDDATKLDGEDQRTAHTVL